MASGNRAAHQPPPAQRSSHSLYAFEQPAMTLNRAGGFFNLTEFPALGAADTLFPLLSKAPCGLEAGNIIGNMSDNVIPFTGPEIDIEVELEFDDFMQEILDTLSHVYQNAIVIVPKDLNGEPKLYTTEKLDPTILSDVLETCLDQI